MLLSRSAILGNRTWRAACATLVAAALAGCNAEQLRYTSLRLSQSVPELQERQVIDNFARMAAGPGNLPYYTVFNTGTVNINDTGGGGLSALSLQHKVYPLGTLNANASRSVTGNWTLNALANPDRLRAMRAAYMMALGRGPLDPVDESKLQAILTGQPESAIHTGWICSGGKHDVPHDAWISGRCGTTTVWVMPQYAKEFADFSLLMLNIATWSPPAGPNAVSLLVDKAIPIVIGTAPRHLTGPPARELPDALPRSQPVIPPLPDSLLPDGAAASALTPTFPRRLYEDTPGLNRGLFFVPR
jgi:hypothetical protein